MKRNIAVILVCILHVVGIAWMMSPYRDYFVYLTPFHLSIVAWLLIINTEYRKASFQSFLGICFIGGWLIEVAGVHTGKIFGVYTYGETLGPKILDVPVIIGVNWFMLSYTLLCVTQKITSSHILNATIVAVLMTAFDFIMEPVAVRCGFWAWKGAQIPLQNYLAWFVCAWLFAFAGLKLKIQLENRLAAVILCCLTLFFLILDIVFHLKL